MMALLRSDLYRTLRARWPWAVLALVALATLGSAVFTIWWPLEPGIVYDGLTGRDGALRLAGRGASITLVQMVAVFVAAHLSCADTDAGFDRTLLSSLRGRVSYFAEKYLLTVILSGSLLLAYLALSGVGDHASGGKRRAALAGRCLGGGGLACGVRLCARRAARGAAHARQGDCLYHCVPAALGCRGTGVL